jgi:hypothetical protein
LVGEFAATWALGHECFEYIPVSKENPIEFKNKDFRGINLSKMNLEHFKFSHCDLRLTHIGLNGTLTKSSITSDNILDDTLLYDACMSENYELISWLLSLKPTTKQLKKLIYRENFYDACSLIQQYPDRKEKAYPLIYQIVAKNKAKVLELILNYDSSLELVVYDDFILWDKTILHTAVSGHSNDSLQTILDSPCWPGTKDRALKCKIHTSS